MNRQKIAFLFFLVGLFLPVSFVSAATIISPYTFAWSNNVGYINFENVIVTSQTLSGYAWSANSGWIKFNPEKGGVINDGNGNLSGSAWGENLGWIDFSQVKISTTTGRFSGTATGALAGIINFNCGNYCDVRTDWRPPSGGGGGSGSSPILPTIITPSSEPVVAPSIPQHVDALNTQLSILETQSGTLVQDTKAGKVVLDIPAGDVASRTVFHITEEPQVTALTTQPCNQYLNKYIKFGAQNDVKEVSKLQTFLKNYAGFANLLVTGVYDQSSFEAVKKFQTQYTNDVLSPWNEVLPTGYVYTTTTKKINELYCQAVSTNKPLVSVDTQLVNNAFYRITAEDENGKTLPTVQYPVTITLPVPANLVGAKNLNVYWLNEKNQKWVMIPDAQFANGKAVFHVNLLARFAIFAAKNTILDIPINTKLNKPLPLVNKVPPKKQPAAPAQQKQSVPAGTKPNTVDFQLNVTTPEKPKETPKPATNSVWGWITNTLNTIFK